MADQEGYELHGVYEAVSVSSDSAPTSPKDPDGTRSLTLMTRPGTGDDPYGGWKQVDSMHDVEVSELPDGAGLDPYDTASYGYNDDRNYAVYVKAGDTVTVACHDTPEGSA